MAGVDQSTNSSSGEHSTASSLKEVFSGCSSWRNILIGKILKLLLLLKTLDSLAKLLVGKLRSGYLSVRIAGSEKLLVSSLARYFTVVRELTDAQEINDVFQNGDINMVLVFPERFSEKLRNGEGADIQFFIDGTDPNQASMLNGYASGVLASYQAEQAELFHQPYQIRTETRMLYNPQGESAYNFVPGVMGLVLMLICAMMTSVAIVREKETGTMEVLLASPMKPAQIILSKMAPYFVISVTNLITILLIATFIMDVPIRGSLFWLSVVSLCFVFVALAFGLLISTIVDTQMAALLVSGVGLMMPVMIFSGLIFPLESMPWGLRWISDFIPARWYISAVRKIMIEGVGVEYFAKELGIIILMAVFLMAVAWKKFKIRLS